MRDIADLGLTLPEAKQLLTRVQQAVVAAQARDHAALRPACSCCGARCHAKDWQSRQVATLFGTVAVRLPRLRCSGCGRVETGINWPAHCRSTPALDQLQAHLSALMSYRVAAGVLAHLLPVAAGTSPETFRGHTLKFGEELRDAAAVRPAAAAPASAVAISLDSTFIRSCHDGERHLEVRVGNIEKPDGGRHVFGAVARSATDITALIRRSLETMGRTGDTALTAFTDGCSTMRSILAAAGVAGPPILDWFHLSMRLQHARQAAEGLPAETPDQQQARAAIVEQVERLRWQAWNGKTEKARLTLKRIRTLMSAFKGRKVGEPVRKLRRAVGRVDSYLRSQSAWLVNYAERHRAGSRVGTSITEGTANSLVNRRMAKSIV
ncbi:MAG: ISKra4 family transposase [Acetobacteraceae bacterium]|nr:ISKra4 family transposase [Acetobacteraceae bacterium]